MFKIHINFNSIVNMNICKVIYKIRIRLTCVIDNYNFHQIITLVKAVKNIMLLFKLFCRISVSVYIWFVNNFLSEISDRAREMLYSRRTSVFSNKDPLSSFENTTGQFLYYYFQIRRSLLYLFRQIQIKLIFNLI